jgi:hypothetical protein
MKYDISFFVFLLCASGCAFQEVHTVPTWVFHSPSTQEYIYVIGTSGRSQSHWEAKEIALQDAFVKLAQSVGTQVFSKEIRRVHGGQQWGGGAMIQTSTSAALQNAEMVEFWADPKGKAGSGYQVYVLLRVKRSLVRGL